MDLDSRWSALFKPGDATQYFIAENPGRIRADVGGYHATNAWWLAELSRLVYKQEADEVGARAMGPRRRDILQPVGLTERRFLNQGGTQCAIVEPHPHDGDMFTVLVFRGTTTFEHWLFNLKAFPTGWREGGLVHRGFTEALDKVWGQVTEYLSAVNWPVFYTGHSLGAALATLAASRSKRPPMAVYTFGSPRVGNSAFVETLRRTPVYRVVNDRDFVPSVPHSQAPFYFSHAGRLYHMTSDNQLVVDTSGKAATDDAVDDRKGGGLSLLNIMVHNRLASPPPFLADHAPTNYVARLERLMSQPSGHMSAP